MATKLSPKEVTEINAVIAEVTKAIKPTSEIGACDKATLSGLLATSKIEKTLVYFKCKREYSNEIVNYFIKEKKLTKSKFHKNAQAHIFVIN
jgi:hypothetical protein